MWLLYKISDIVVMTFVSLVLMAAISPLVDRLETIRFPRVLSIVLIYVAIWAVVGTMFAGLVPAVIEQTSKLVVRIPQAISQIEFLSSHQQEITQQALGLVATLPEDIFKLTLGLVNNIVSVLTIMVITFYMLLERKTIDSHVPDKFKETVTRAEKNLGAWLRGELILMTVVGLLTYIGLLILGVDSALPLALLAGLLEIIPTFGPTISAIPAVLVALTISPVVAVATGTLYWIVQLLENNLLVPKVMSHALGVSPVIVFLGLMIGFRLNGPGGAIMAVPVIIVLKTVLSSIMKAPGGR